MNLLWTKPEVSLRRRRVWNQGKELVACTLWPQYLLLAFFCSPPFVSAQTDATQTPSLSIGQNSSATLTLIDRLVQQNAELEKQNKELMQQIESLRQGLQKERSMESGAPIQHVTATAQTSTESASGDVQEHKATPSPNAEEPDKWGGYTPNFGFEVAN